ncbi:hypothetical protein [Actinocorallia longicatena]|uniref:Uncharacterized protein n=1 Tax=Actinocorallia longicatena TaxID=111803 RepID=A0ABP6Q1W2_9ACTN
MVPTLLGRIQTRLFLLATVGVLVTAIIGPVLPGTSGSLSGVYRTTFVVLLAVAVIGVGWELVYHGLMQFRWEKDWPSMFGLLNLINEGVLLFVLLRLDLIPGITAAPSASTFWVDFTVVWVAVWLFANGPMRVPFVRWRFRGGRLA